MRRRERPFAAVVRVKGDPSDGAFYGWRLQGSASSQRTILIKLPAPSPTGNLWACRCENGRLHWEIPQQHHRGRDVTLSIAKRTCAIATAPVGVDVPPETFMLGPFDCCGSSTLNHAVIIAGQHPGEDASLRVARIIAARTRQWANGNQPALRISIVSLANASGRRSGHTRETSLGRDPNRLWHIAGADPEVDRLRALVSGASFVVDLHADEYSAAPYVVRPAPCPTSVASDVASFFNGFERAYAGRLQRPRAPGFGEDHPGILINWLAARGVPGVMIELPMRYRRGRERGDAERRLSRLEERISDATIAGLMQLARIQALSRQETGY